MHTNIAITLNAYPKTHTTNLVKGQNLHCRHFTLRAPPHFAPRFLGLSKYRPSPFLLPFKGSKKAETKRQVNRMSVEKEVDDKGEKMAAKDDLSYFRDRSCEAFERGLNGLNG